jgi:hypothetical protein
MLLLLLVVNTVYGLQQESEIEIKNLTIWQWEKVRDDMNFTGLKMSEEVIEYNKIVDDYDGQVYGYKEGTEPYIKSKIKQEMDYWNRYLMK